MSTIVRVNGDSKAMSMLLRRNCQRLFRKSFQPPSVEMSIRKQRAPPTGRQVEAVMKYLVLKEDSDCRQPQPTIHVATARRVTNALTAKEIYDSALDPALVPQPLTLRGQHRNVSAPAALQTTRSDTPRFAAVSKVVTGDDTSHTYFRSRPRSHQHALLDTSARLIAGGIGAADVAQFMGLTLQELVHEIARFTLAARDTPSIVEEEIRTFYASNPASLDSRLLRSGEIPPNITDMHVTDTQGDQVQNEEALYDSQSDAAEEGPWTSIEEVASGEGSVEDGAHQHDDGVSVYHDTLESLEKGSVPHQQPIQQREHHTTTCCRRPPWLEFWHRHIPDALPAQTTQASLSNTTGSSSSQIAQPSTLAPLLMGIRTTIFASLAIIIGRLLGILLSELQTLLANQEYSLINILDTVSGWARVVALLLAMVLCVQLYARKRS
ncbi:hypothetical protein A1O7_02104 [Cladophialophora yegresii CBS 114405]|uniref:Uncharacterized protein n=1 Tax=Cladophialophora yegresii CBS 114405 TaxID=1182544 RepID=W9W9K0_9EURO|nr:uncharacterized protein A1O7_02104 [Cladophialophora yegresii CBS 114405]EXJ61675.1 hypothetical protein A1O7_02104 [Cladophialophora yegresii CBS 114405]